MRTGLFEEGGNSRIYTAKDFMMAWERGVCLGYAQIYLLSRRFLLPIIHFVF